MRLKLLPHILLYAVMAGALPLAALEKCQYMPGQFGLNAGILPSPGFTYQNMEINYNTSTLNDSKGDALPIKPSLNLWVVENCRRHSSKKIRSGRSRTVTPPTAAAPSSTAQ